MDLKTLEIQPAVKKKVGFYFLSRKIFLHCLKYFFPFKYLNAILKCFFSQKIVYLKYSECFLNLKRNSCSVSLIYNNSVPLSSDTHWQGGVYHIYKKVYALCLCIESNTQILYLDTVRYRDFTVVYRMYTSGEVISQILR